MVITEQERQKAGLDQACEHRVGSDKCKLKFTQPVCV